MSLIFKQFKTKEWLSAFVCLILVTCQVACELEIPDYMSSITAMLQVSGTTMADIWVEGRMMLVFAFLSLACSFSVGFFASRLGAEFSRRARLELYNKVESFSMEEIERFSIASLITRSTNDIVQVQMLVVMGLQVMIKAPIMSVWAISKIITKNWYWTLATGCAVFVLICIVTVLLVFAFPKFTVIQYQTDRLNASTRENLTGVRVVRAYNAEGYQEAKFEKNNAEFTKTNLFVNRMMAVMQPGMQFIMNSLTMSIYWIGAYLINEATMLEKIDIFSNMIVFSTYAMQVVMSFMMLVMISIMLPRALVAAKRVLEVLDTEPTIIDGEIKDTAMTARGEIEFKNVSFKYPGAQNCVLTDISFTASPGETVAFIGSTGSGKSTVINLIPRFYDTTEGEILIDGVNVRDYNLHNLRNIMSYVPQRAVLFGSKISENIAYGDNGRADAGDEQIKEAARIAQASNFIEALDEGYDLELAQGGTNLSGGQRQRVSIARAICRQPKIYIFDDSFSALDYKTDRILRDELKKSTADATVLIVAQRVSTIRYADRIVVLDEGKVVGIGTHDELVKSCKVYHEIASSQLEKEEM